MTRVHVRLGAMFVIAGVVLTSCGASDGTTLFPLADYLHDPIPADRQLDQASEEMIGRLTARPEPAAAMLVEYGIPIVEADESSPTVSVTCTSERDEQCGLERLETVRIPADASPNTGSDGALAVIDEERGVTYELWRARRISSTAWSAEWGSTNDLGGDGIAESGGSGSGLSRLAGVIRVDELRQGSIDHAIAISSSETCETMPRYPAWSTDGTKEGPDCLPMGARLQLDPSIDLDTLELREGERLIAEALQAHGAYVVDSSANPLSLFFELEPPERPDDELGPVLLGLDFRWDYDHLEGIPWDRLQVLRSWDGS
jgi:hypothetical protein